MEPGWCSIRRKVILVQLYREFVTKVQDVETGQQFYVFSSELESVR